MNKWDISKQEQRRYISAFSEVLAPLRAKMGISQSDLASSVGISRQTYSAIESGKREMSWTIYLSLLMFFDNNVATSQLLRDFAVFPDDLFRRFNDGILIGTPKRAEVFGKQSEEIFEMISSLDEQGMHSLKTILLVEYARCANLPGDTVIKAFDGSEFAVETTKNIEVTQAIKHIQTINEE